MSVSERALDDTRVEWVPETTPGVTPTDPAWNLLGDHIKSVPGFSGGPSVDAGEVVGNSDTEQHFRGSTDNSLSFSWWMQRFFVDTNGNANDPVGELLTRGPGDSLTSHSVVVRQERDFGGKLDAGFRKYVVGRGAYPSSGSAPGDPSQSEPIVAECEYGQVQYAETHVIHQPGSATTLVVANDGSTSVDVTIEDEGAATAETVSVAGGGAVETASSFGDIDAIWVHSEPDGDIRVGTPDGSTTATDIKTPLLEDPITGSATDGVDGERGVPALGAGSHAAAIGTDPESYQFLGTQSSFDGGAIANRVHALDLSVEIDLSTEAQQGTRAPAVDPGMRTVSVDADTAGPFESAVRYKEYMTGKTGALVYTYPDGDVTVNNAQLTDVDELDFESGDANSVFSSTFEGSGSPSVTATHN